MADSPSKSLRLRDLDREERRRVSVASALRSGLLVVALLLLYSLWPFEEAPGGAGEVAALVLAAGVFVWVLVRQVRHIMAARLPELRAVEALVVTGTLFVVLVSGTYVYLSAASPAAFSEPLDRIGAFYFTVAVLTTVGFGDIHPVTPLARVMVTGQMVMNAIFIGVVVRVLFAAARTGLRETPVRPGDTPAS